ncbi:hypothetical protein U8607_18065 [Methylobacterium durans]|uniref:hypothetical protein n=1 Tax=Methylobacterium durans TaxID=2202825 RepID=UPI002AFFED52|nr:hypothetical protein [Methylobacterium durans]MEA1833997.1 hypothetical protein [Methylobacterium durans]
MDKNVTVKLFRIERANETVPRIIDVLRRIDAIQGYGNRERHIGSNFVVRLESLDEENQHVVCGELTRIQSTNMPSEVTTAGRTALSTQNRLGHSVVFRINHHLGLLGMEFNSRVCSPGRLIGYLAEFDPTAAYRMLPLVREDAWERYNRSEPRKIQVSVASPTDLSVLDGDGRAVGEAIAAMGEAYEAPKITVEISMGQARGHLGQRITGFVHELLTKSSQEEIQLEKLKAFTPDFPEGIDFLDELVVFREELSLHDRDPDINFSIKKDYLRRVMYGQS